MTTLHEFHTVIHPTSSIGLFQFSSRIEERLQPYQPVFLGRTSYATALSESISKAKGWSEAGMSTVRIVLDLLELLEQSYTFETPKTVWAFLTAHPFLVPLLVEAYRPIQQHFPNSSIHLRVVNDPETTGAVELVASIVPIDPPEQAVESFMHLLENWWLDALDRAQDKLTITIEYR